MGAACTVSWSVNSASEAEDGYSSWPVAVGSGTVSPEMRVKRCPIRMEMQGVRSCLESGKNHNDDHQSLKGYALMLLQYSKKPFSNLLLYFVPEHGSPQRVPY